MEPLLVMLFGSIATGEYTQHSDADILVLFKESVDWLSVYEKSDGIVQPIVKSLPEITKALADREPFYQQILDEGVVLYDSGDVFQQLVRIGATK